MRPVPKIDTLAGIGCYCTSFEGIGGSIKQKESGFRVSEIVSNSLLSGRSDSYDNGHRYPLYVLEKQGIDSNHALMELEREARVRLRIIGIKDAKAVTRQYASLVRPEPNPVSQIKTRHSILTLQGFVAKPLSKNHLMGNSFTVELYDAQTSDLRGICSEMNKIVNFYGLQRFGSERLVTHLVGKSIIRRDFKSATELLLSYTTEYDSTFSREIREQLRDPANYAKVAKTLPNGMDIERRLVLSLESGKDHREALRSIPLTIRRLFVQAYQAFIFNKCLSICISSGQDVTLPCEGDLVFEMDGEFSFGRIVRYQSGTKRMSAPAVMLPGYSFQTRPGRFEKTTVTIMADEGVSPRDFYIKEMDELSHQGGYRQAPLLCKEFSYSANPQTVSFRLPKGSYATILLREIMKPVDPIKSGF